MYYKFLDSEYVPNTLIGKLKLSRLSYYKLLEHRFKDNNIGDKNEGKIINKIASTDLGANETLRSALESRRFIKSESGGRYILENVRVVEDVPDCHVWCISQGNIHDLCKTWLGRPYSSYVEIIDPREMAAEIFRSGVDAKSNLAISDLFEPPVFDHVNYIGIESDVIDNILSDPSPFRKNISYCSQQEARIVFWSRHGAIDDHLIIKFQNSNRYLRAGLIGEDKPKESYTTKKDFADVLARAEHISVELEKDIFSNLGDLADEIWGIIWDARELGFRADSIYPTMEVGARSTVKFGLDQLVYRMQNGEFADPFEKHGQR